MSILKKKLDNLVRWFTKHLRACIYLSTAIVGITCLVISFFVTGNWPNVLCGVGTGLLTSLIVSVMINYENDIRLKKKSADDKRFILNDIVYYSKDIYIDIIYRINEYLMFTKGQCKPIFAAYDDFKQIIEFCNNISKISISQVSEDERSRLEKLLNLRSYRFDGIISEIKRLPRQEYYLRGLLSKDECEALISAVNVDQYLQYAERIDEFWNYNIIDLQKCTMFLRMTLYICVNIIRAIDYCKVSVEAAEKDLKETLDQLYYDEIYSKSDEYIEQMLNRQNEEDEYWASHPEELVEKIKSDEEYANRTPEDRLIDDLYCCICGFSAFSIESILQKLDSNSKKVLIFLLQDDVQKSLRNNRKKRKAIQNKFGKSYKVKALNAKEELTHGQAEHAHAGYDGRKY